MTSGEIKTGIQVVSEFLESLQGDEAIDAATLGALHRLFKTGRLNKTQLLNALERLRTQAVAQDPQPPDADGSSYD